MGENPSSDKACGPECPVTNLSWLDTLAYLNALSAKDPDVSEPCYRIFGNEAERIEECDGYRLPKAAEWEIAASAGTRMRYAGTDDLAEVCLYANVSDVTLGHPEWERYDCDDGVAGLAPVASFRPNDFGLYDMTGNAAEWVYRGDLIDPKLNSLVLEFRGGSYWRNSAIGSGGSTIGAWPYPYTGCRVARSFP